MSIDSKNLSVPAPAPTGYLPERKFVAKNDTVLFERKWLSLHFEVDRWISLLKKIKSHH